MKGTIVKPLKKRVGRFMTHYKNVYYRGRKGFKVDGCLVPFTTQIEGNQMLRESLEGGEPLMVSRNGRSELVCAVRKKISPKWFDSLCNNAGFFPKDISLRQRYMQVYHESCRRLDLLAIINYRHGLFKEEEWIFRTFSPNARLIDFNVLSPFVYEKPWSMALKDKRILVIHPFVNSIKKQYEVREKLFEDPDVLPEFASLDVMPAVQSIGGQCEDFETWFDALDYMKAEVETYEFDIALIGCGAYGLMLAAHVKSLGKQAVHVGGALQLLFGIKGKRWEHPSYAYDKHFYNEHWIRPSEDETPRKAKAVEGGCYW